ncbi:DMT family transporter [Actinoallomurus iriomotensis]|uniref:Transporter n=1 Tax=Actinoallomurus iriomotensis TaxID=478107 RepID=A0A9W6RPU7_9ACTN|nr:EamA family transporter [Actinoallomurus iriomotensis]GLY77967.1 transporter [Actinoallomurus iriomotensis]
MEQRNDVSGVLLVLMAGILWGTVGPAQVLADVPAGPVALGGARILLGGVVLAVAVLVTAPRAYRTLSRTTWPPLLAATAATATFQAAFMTSVARTGAAVATAIAFGIAPVSTGVCERLVLGTRLTRRWIAGTAGAIAGCALVMTPAGAVRVDAYGAAFGVLAGGCFGVYTVSAKRLIQKGAGMPAAVSITLLAGGAVLAPWTLAGLPALGTVRGLALVTWLGPITAALAYWFFVTGLRRVTAATAGTLSLAEPLVAAALAVSVLGERPSAPVTAGSVLLLGGLAIVSVPSRRTPPGAGQRTLCSPPPGTRPRPNGSAPRVRWGSRRNSRFSFRSGTSV